MYTKFIRCSYRPIIVHTHSLFIRDASDWVKSGMLWRVRCTFLLVFCCSSFLLFYFIFDFIASERVHGECSLRAWNSFGWILSSAKSGKCVFEKERVKRKIFWWVFIVWTALMVMLWDTFPFSGEKYTGQRIDAFSLWFSPFLHIKCIHFEVCLSVSHCTKHVGCSLQTISELSVVKRTVHSLS